MFRVMEAKGFGIRGSLFIVIDAFLVIWWENTIFTLSPPVGIPNVNRCSGFVNNFNSS